MTAPRDFCAFILSHGRPRHVPTARALVRQGYTGPWFLLLDNEDPSRPEYVRRFGPDRVLVFDKAAVAETFDPGDLSPDRRTVAYARNACFGIAREKGFGTFLQLDDDYTHFAHRYAERGQLRTVMVSDLDRLFAAMLAFLSASGAASVALGQGGDFIGGVGSARFRTRVIRKAMNTFFCRTDAPWRFVGRMNEDVNAYTALAHRGLLFLTALHANIDQANTQRTPGGMTAAYRDGGTYAKSFYSVMMCPSAVRVALLRDDYSRIHHQVRWNRCAPLILAEEHRRG